MLGEKKFVIENQSLSYLYPSEGIGVASTLAMFNGTNFDWWRKAVRTTLKSNNKLGFIEGTLAKPMAKGNEGHSELVAWEMANSMIYS